MGIDRIGKNPPPPPTPEKTATRSTDPFEVPGTSPSAAAQPSADVRSADATLDRWKSGEIDLDGYLDAKVNEAIGHLGVLPTAQLDAIRQALRERLASDPTLVELVRTVTGRVPDSEGEK